MPYIGAVRCFCYSWTGAWSYPQLSGQQDWVTSYLSTSAMNITILNIAIIFPITIIITNNTFSCWYLIIPTASRRQDWIISHLPTPAHIINQDQSNFQWRKNFGYKVQFRRYLCTLDFKRAHQILLSISFPLRGEKGVRVPPIPLKVFLEEIK